MGFQSIVADATSIVGGVASIFGGDSDTPFPKAFGESVSNPIKENNKNWRKSRGYVFQVVRVGSDGAVNEAPSGPKGDRWAEFRLQINPQQLQQDEIFAIEVTPTFSGVLVEHQGTTLKDIMISGTTGISPGRGPGGAFPQTGRPVFASGHSGYKEFHELRTYFRAYVEQKRNDPGSGDGELRMVWRNLKDNEDLYVEPQRFTMKRQAGKPFLYEYTIALKSIGKAESAAKAGDFLAALDDTLEDINDLLQTAGQLIAGGFGLLSQVESTLASTVLGPVNAYAQAIKAYNNGVSQQKSVSDQIKALKSKINANLSVVQENNAGKQKKVKAAKEAELAKQKAALLAAIAKAAFNKADVKALKAKLDDVAAQFLAKIKADQAITNAAVTYAQAQALKGLSAAKLAMDKIIQSNVIQGDVIDSKVVTNAVYLESKSNTMKAASAAALADKQKAVSDTIKSGDKLAAAQAKADLTALQQTIAASGKAQAAKNAITSSGAVAKSVVIGGGMTIQTLAAQEMGSPDKFKDLALLNGLIPPYVDPTPVDIGHPKVAGVLRPGDQIYVPTAGQPASGTGVVTKSDTAPIIAGLLAAEKNFGVDLQLTDDFDLAVQNNGDIKLVAGTPNIIQRILLKLLLEPGSLKQHQGIGAGLRIGQKLPDDPEVVLGRIRSSVESDNAVVSVIFSEVVQEGSSVKVNLVLKLKDSDQPISTSFKVA